MDFGFAPRAKPERLQCAKPPSSLRHHLTKLGYKHQRISPGRFANPICYSVPETPAFTWSCVPPNGKQSHPKGLPERRARLRFTSYRTT
ncbi:hypothetical protein ElyMa_003899100 [Elysia marginata]|uniref:Uncharacterized protein n=1 Tax=Elysia marginata TaxID=1093978 RepID=A0AAV4FN19_9GAST|nr:hypothetical protein ElyMa_003899100 [Elysia marginata]